MQGITTFVEVEATVENVILLRQEREGKTWNAHKRELVPTGVTQRRWMIRLQDCDRKDIFDSRFPAAVFQWVGWGKEPQVQVGKRYSFSVSVKGEWRDLVGVREIQPSPAAT